MKPDPRLAKPKPPTVYKTRVLDLIDRLSKDPDVLRRSIDQLKKGDSLIQVGAVSGVVEGDDQRKDHIEQHWLGDARRQQVFATALIRAGELALERGLPIDAYWVFAGSRFEVAVSHNREQVTLLVVTPLPDVPTQGDAPPHPRIEIFR